MKWKRKRLGDVADLCLGKMLDQNKNKGDLLPYLANINVRWGEFDLADLREMRFEPHEAERYGLKFGDIVMCEGGEPGRCAIWKDQAAGMMIQKALHRIRPHAGLDANFLYYWFLQEGRSGGFGHLFTGATIKHLPGQNLAKLVVPLPPVAAQQRIAEILTAYDDLLENNRRRMELLERAARLLYEEWFVRLRYPGHTRTRRPDSLPKGWERVPTPDAVDVNPTTRLSDAEEHWYVEMADLPTDSMVIQGAVMRDGRSGSKFRNGDTLFARITPCLENGKTGFVDFMGDGEAGRGSTEFIVLRSRRLTPEFVYCLARTYSFRENAIKSMVGSSGRQRVQESCFEKHQIVVPPAGILSQFSEAAAPMFHQIKNLHTQNQKLRHARDLLLPRLMSGEVAV